MPYSGIPVVGTPTEHPPIKGGLLSCAVIGYGTRVPILSPDFVVLSDETGNYNIVLPHYLVTTWHLDSDGKRKIKPASASFNLTAG
jgi:hypothetical protein